MTDYFGHSICVDPKVDYYYMGINYGPVFGEIVIWTSYCPAPTEETAEYDFTPAVDEYVSFLHTDDARPTLLQFNATGYVNFSTVRDCISPTLYGAFAWDNGKKKALVVNATKNAKGLHLADILYQGTVDFANAWSGVTTDPLPTITAHDIRIDENDKCEMLFLNTRYVSAMTVDETLVPTLRYNATYRHYAPGAEHLACSCYTEAPNLEFYGLLFCNYEPNVTPTATIQYAASPDGPWSDYSPTDTFWDVRYDNIVAGIPYAMLTPETDTYLRLVVHYGTQTLTGCIYRWHYNGNMGYTLALYQSLILNGVCTDIQRVRYGPTNGTVVVRELVKTYTDVAYSTGDPGATSTAYRITERAWATFWNDPIVIMDISNLYRKEFSTGYFADGSEGIAVPNTTFGALAKPAIALYRYINGAWENVTINEFPDDGYYWAADSYTLLVGLPNPTLVTYIEQNDPYEQGIAFYDLTLGTWTVQKSNLIAAWGFSFNATLDKMFFTSIDYYWYCTSAALPSNAIWFVNSM